MITMTNDELAVLFEKLIGIAISDALDSQLPKQEAVRQAGGKVVNLLFSVITDKQQRLEAVEYLESRYKGDRPLP